MIIVGLAQRHLRLFFRDKMTVFFSLLSPLIMLVLYTFFLANVQTENLTEAFPRVSPEKIDQFITSWVYAGIVMISTLTTGLAALHIFVDDRASDRFKDFAVSPISKGQLILGYLLSTFLIALIMTTVVFAASEAYIVITGGTLLSVENLMNVYGAIILLCAGFAALSSFFVTFIRSNAAFTSLSVIVGTMVGFLAGIYIQPGSLGVGVVNFMNSLPFSQAAALIREPFTQDTLARLSSNNTVIADKLREQYGIGSLHIGDFILDTQQIAFIFVAIVVIFTLLSIWRLGKKIG